MMKRRFWMLTCSLPTCLLAALLLLPAGCGKKKKSSDSDDEPSSSSMTTAPASAVGAVQMASMRAKDSNNLKQMAIAFHCDCDAHQGRLPLAAICDPTGKPLLSWRVAMLPYVEHQNLYQQFKLNEPWDSPANKPLLAQMPKVYANPGRVQPGDTTTYYRVFATLDPTSTPKPPWTMPVAGRGVPQTWSLGALPDGTSNTILIVEAEEGVPWTKPDELIYDPKKPLPALSYFFNGVSNVAMADGSVRLLPKTVSEKTLRNAITMDDGIPLGTDW